MDFIFIFLYSLSGDYMRTAEARFIKNGWHASFQLQYMMITRVTILYIKTIFFRAVLCNSTVCSYINPKVLLKGLNILW